MTDLGKTMQIQTTDWFMLISGKDSCPFHHSISKHISTTPGNIVTHIFAKWNSTRSFGILSEKFHRQLDVSLNGCISESLLGNAAYLQKSIDVGIYRFSIFLLLLFYSVSYIFSLAGLVIVFFCLILLCVVLVWSVRMWWKNHC